MHGNLEPEEHLFDESPSDLWDDMAKLNSLYQELMWDDEDVLQFSADFAKDCIIITNKSRKKN
jgi:hypothetical protein|tara:strand:+ start:422 stop:610 length:189 start_codon:yes stop_codon:yes gene_type:complete